MTKKTMKVTPNSSTNPTPNTTPFTSPDRITNRRTNIVSPETLNQNTPQINQNNNFRTPTRETSNTRRRIRTPSPPRRNTRRNTGRNNPSNTHPPPKFGGNKNMKTRKNVVLLPKLRKIDDSNKKYKYKLSNSTTLRKRAINEGIRSEVKKMNKTQRQAAVSKKGRFNILRIYRRNNNKEQCKKITKDMRYIDKKYGLIKTKDICKGGSKKNKHTSSDKEFLEKKKEKLQEKQDLCRLFGIYESPERNPKKKIPAYCYTDPHGVKEFQNKFKENIENEGKFKDAQEAGLTFGGKKKTKNQEEIEKAQHETSKELIALKRENRRLLREIAIFIGQRIFLKNSLEAAIDREKGLLSKYQNQSNFYVENIKIKMENNEENNGENIENIEEMIEELNKVEDIIKIITDRIKRYLGQLGNIIDSIFELNTRKQQLEQDNYRN